MRYATVAGMLAAIVATANIGFAQDAPVANPPVLTNHELLHKYVWSALGAEGALSATLFAGFDQWRDAPSDWGGGGEAYAKRWASDFAGSAIGSTTKYGVARLLHQDPSFTRCDCAGFGPRLRHALRSPFMARTRDGREVFSPATVAGLTAENVIPASTWYPAQSGARDGSLHAALGVLSKMGVDTFREFAPWGHRKPRS